MKKTLLIIFLMVGAILPQTVSAQQIPMHIIDETPAGPGGPLAPPFTLVLLDEDGVVVYSTFVPAGTTMIVLPSTLSDDFELRLVGDTYYYRGYINL